MSNVVQEVEIAKIHQGKRVRKALGDIAALAASISKIGLLHPIVVDPQFRLIVGSRRLAAYRQLKRTEIPAIIATSFGHIETSLYAERDENIERKNFDPSEIDAMAKVLEPYEQKEAETRLHHSPGRPLKTSASTKKPSKSFTRFSQDNTKRSKSRTAKVLGVSAPTLAKIQEVIEAADGNPEAFGDLVTKMDKTGKVDGAHRELKKRRKVAELRKKEQEPTPVTGAYDVIVIDPPWPVAIQGREERPQQVGLPYTAMTVKDIKALPLPLANDCHVWLWTTQHFLPDALQCLQAWHLNYVCCFVWMKPGGMQPMYLPQFNCEFALYARQGNPPFVETKDFATCFTAPRTEHSEKPQLFYDMVQRVTAGRRLDMFNRRPIAGFEGWGKEVHKESV